MPGGEKTPPGRLPGQPKILFKDEGAAEGQRTKPTPSPAPLPASPPREPARLRFPSGAAATPAAPQTPARRSAPAVPFGAPKPQPPKDQRPKVIGAGTLRRRIPCSIADLQGLDAAVAPAIARQALYLIERTNLDDEHFDDVLRFGAELQAEHGAVAEAELTLANDAFFQQGQTALARMIQLFGDLDPQRVFAERQPALIDKLKSMIDPPRPPNDIFGERYPSLLSLAQELKTLEPQLLRHAQRVTALGARYRALTERIASHVLAATFLVRYLRDHPVTDGRQAHYATQADVLETRATSLLATRATIEMGSLNNQVLQESAQILIAAGRGMLEEDLPAFHTAYTAALTAAAQSRTAVTSTTSFQSVRDVHARVMRKMQGEIR